MSIVYGHTVACMFKSCYPHCEQLLSSNLFNQYQLSHSWRSTGCQFNSLYYFHCSYSWDCYKILYVDDSCFINNNTAYINQTVPILYIPGSEFVNDSNLVLFTLSLSSPGRDMQQIEQAVELQEEAMIEWVINFYELNCFEETNLHLFFVSFPVPGHHCPSASTIYRKVSNKSQCLTFYIINEVGHLTTSVDHLAEFCQNYHLAAICTQLMVKFFLQLRFIQYFDCKCMKIPDFSRIDSHFVA